MRNFKINWKALFIVSVLLPLPIVLTNIFNGSMPFWFDPARDFLAGLANQHKLTLIGQPTGIPGLFYGPYWVWLLSAALFVSKDPRVVQFLVLGTPYTIIFPIVLYKFKNILGIKTVIALWLLFIFSFMRYAIFPWNPHLAPLFTLVVIYLLIKEKEDKKLLYIFGAGFVSGLIGNFHISFDMALLIGIFLYFLIQFFERINLANVKKTVINCFVFGSGFLLAFTPFIIFEIRHGFFQTKIVLNTLFSPYPQVGLKGLTQSEILKDFASIPGQIFQAPLSIGIIAIVILIFLLLILRFQKKLKFEKEEKNLFIICIAVLLSVLFVFLKSKNPVWEYHFIAVEIPFLLFIGLLVKKIPLASLVMFVWSLVIVLQAYFNFFFVPRPSVLSYDSLAKKEYITNLIGSDSKKENYTVFIYNPAIYTYEYTYLFSWLVGKDVPFDPSLIQKGGKLVYLVIQKTDQGVYQDFINSHAPESNYQTTSTWKIEDGTVVLRRELKSK